MRTVIGGACGWTVARDCNPRAGHTLKFTVAIDGPAAAGKGTISRAVAAHFGFAHLDTGLLYRAVGRRLLGGEDPLAAARALHAGDLAATDLRSAAVAQAASQVATRPEVRAALVDFQRSFASRDGGAVLDGRDIGTVICPDAEVKLFITARPDIRARRRFSEESAAGIATDYATVLADVKARDARDRSRSEAPLMAAPDATVLDTSDLGVADAVAEAVALIEGVARP